MVAAAKTDSKIAARVKHFAYRVPLEFYDYQQDPDALHNLIADPELKHHVYSLTAKLLQHMQTTNDPQLAAFKQTVGIE